MLLLRLPAVFPSPAAAAFLARKRLSASSFEMGSSADEGASGAKSGGVSIDVL